MLRTAILNVFVISLVSMAVGCGNAADNNASGSGPAAPGSTRTLPVETTTGIKLPAHVPDDYRGKTNPFARDDAEAIQAGGNLYHQVCASCHGLQGAGDGPSGMMLTPAPAILTDAAVRRMADDYIFWRISEGGMVEPFMSAGSGMTPVGYLTEDERWQIITFVRSLKE